MLYEDAEERQRQWKVEADCVETQIQLEIAQISLRKKYKENSFSACLKPARVFDERNKFIWWKKNN